MPYICLDENEIIQKGDVILFEERAVVLLQYCVIRRMNNDNYSTL